MSVKLLFNEGHDKKGNLQTPQIGDMTREVYEDLLNIRDKVCKAIDIGDNHELVRVRFIRDYPHATFRVTILRRYKESHTVKKKDGGTTLLSPGVYVERQFLVEKVSSLEFVFTPALPERIADA